MNIALIFAIICGLFATAVLVVAVWLIASGMKNAMRNGSVTDVKEDFRSGSQPEPEK